MAEQEHWITPDQLQVGIYVYLDLGWMDHPFSFNSFKIKSDDQIRTIRSLKLKRVRWDPARSDVQPGSPVSAATAAQTPAAAAATTTSAEDAAAKAAEVAAIEAARAAKQARAERLRQNREQMAKVQQAFASASATVRAINKNIFAQSKQTIEQSEQLILQMVSTFLAAPEVAIQVMTEKPGGEEIYLHSINVTVLAMMVGRELGLSSAEMNLLGLGCLFHDIGLTEVPAKIMLKQEPMTKAERDFYEMHCAYGRDIAKRVGLTPAVQNIIYQHHEYQDGSGFPLHLKGEAVDPLARIVVVVNYYDSLCNPPNAANALTPHEALSLMFAQQRSRFDAKVLQILIRCLGVFPPGTVVRLSNDILGLVISINAARPLKPNVIIYDPEVPKHEAIIVDLQEETDISISQAIRPAQLPRPAFDYLSPRKRISYYFDADAGKQTQAA